MPSLFKLVCCLSASIVFGIFGGWAIATGIELLAKKSKEIHDVLP